MACKKNRIKVVELLLRFNAKLEAATESGLTSLHVSAFMGHQNIVLLLLQTGGASPAAVTQRGETPLHLAARANQLEIVRTLLRHGAAVDAKAKACPALLPSCPPVRPLLSCAAQRLPLPRSTRSALRATCEAKAASSCVSVRALLTQWPRAD